MNCVNLFKKKEIIICFFGLIKSLKITLESIKEVIESLKEYYEVYIILHTYDLKVLNTKRNKEKNLKLDTDEWKLLKPNSYKITNQDDFYEEFKNTNAWKSIVQRGVDKAKGWDLDMAKNSVCQLNSLQEASSLFKKNTPVLFLRPDLLYTIKSKKEVLDISKEISEVPTLVYTPVWQKWGGFNDRIAFCGSDAAWIYANRIDAIENFLSSGNKYHSETLLKFSLREVDVKFTCCITAERVRLNGEKKKEHFDGC